MLEGYLNLSVGSDNWKKQFFLLSFDGHLSWGDRKGATKNSIAVTNLTQVDLLREKSGESGLSIAGPGHEPLYVVADAPEVADGWQRAFNIVKAGGSAKLQKENKGTRLKSAFAAKDIIGISTRNKQKTLERKRNKNKMNRQQSDEKFAVESEDDEDGPPPPPPDEFDPLVDIDDAVDLSFEAAEYEDGYLVRIGNSDYFVDSAQWNYFKSRKDFLSGSKPIGRALLSLMV